MKVSFVQYPNQRADMQREDNISVMLFNRWILMEFGSRRMLLLYFIATAMQFFLFKFLYPYPNFMPPDSFSYIEAAYNNQYINVWPIGYSKFLRFFSCFTNSHLVLILFQYLLLLFSVLYFLFSITYWLRQGKWFVRLLVLACIFNPLILHISNFISSDALFISLSMVWFTQLVWIMHSINRRILISHAFILLLSIIVRHNALYYPFVSLLVVFFTHSSVKGKCLYAGCVMLILGSFVGRTMYQYHKETGIIQYAAFGGWQLAANALYGYAHVSPDPIESVPERFRVLHDMVNRHVDSIQKLVIRPDDDITLYYLWSNNAPLKRYMSYYWQQDSNTNGFIRWATMGNLYGNYGRYLIRRHPMAFISYYLWPNLQKYYVPPVGFMGVYNLGNETVDPSVAKWFGWKSNVIKTHFNDTRITVVEYFPVLIAINNVVFLLSFTGLLYVIGFKRFTSYGHGILCWVGMVWLCNILLSVFLAPVELRYQLFPMIVTFAFSVLAIRLLVKVVRAILFGNSFDSIVLLSGNRLDQE